MEIFKFSAPVSSQLPSTLSFITPKPSFQFATTNSHKFRKTHFKPCSYSPLQFSNRFHISAHFSRRSSRHNSLRKKLTNNQQVPLPNCPQVPTFANGKTDNQSNLGATDKIDSGCSHFGRDKGVGESVLWNKLEGWIEQYKKDIEFWGVGSTPIFTVHQDSNGNVKRVLVDDDEILRRSGIVPSEYKEERESEEIGEVSLKISHARFVAKEMERGNYALPKSSSVVKFVAYGDKSRQVTGIRIDATKSDYVLNVSRFGIVPICGLLLVWVVKKLFSRGKGENELTRLEEEMLRRKVSSRKKTETLKDDCSVQVVPEIIVPATDFVERPHLDKDELMHSIRAAMQPTNQMTVLDDRCVQNMDSLVSENRVEEIKKMAMHAHEVEIEVPDSLRSDSSAQLEKTDSTVENGISEVERVSSKVEKSRQIEGKDSQGSLKVLGTSDSRNSVPKEASRKKPRVIRSVAEAREYLSEMSNPQFSNNPCTENTHLSNKSSSNAHTENSHRINGSNGKAQIISFPSPSSVHDSAQEKVGTEKKIGGTLVPDSSICTSQDSILKDEDCLRSKINGVNIDVQNSIVVDNSSCHEDADFNSRKSMPDITSLGESETVPSVKEEELKIEASREKNNWLEKNYDKLLPVLEKMSSGFTDNYVAAREKVKHQLDQGSDLTNLMSALNDNTELEWMNDDKLREIVFKVKDNEIAGRDPFHSMDNEDKFTFFKGLEEKVEKENNKLSGFHEWLHSNIENLDYGADGISLFDSPEKIMPRWKGGAPPLEKISEFLAYTKKADKVTDLPVEGNLNMKLEVHRDNVKPVPKKLKTVIESSDGSVKPGKRNGKEHLQHTKKHSRGFLESYNAEGDPEIKQVMRDIGKDLDRWITEEEVKKAATHLDKLPRRSKAFVEKKLNKLKSEVEQFGTQAVLSKYREYAVEDEEDYLWWLDLSFVLCIELYTQEGEEMKVGFYTLEMAADLELDPKPYHVIAFEEAGECKNLCYIIQSHLEMLGKDGKAFVVAQPPKEAFRDAKSNGYGVTVIRKGELALNVDQRLEEVEDLITEIGSKMYHDKIMKERSVDIRSVIKGVLATSKPAKRKSGKKLGLRKPKK